MVGKRFVWELTNRWGMSKPRGKNKKCRGPKSDKDPESFSMSVGIRSFTFGHIPDKDGSNDGSKTGNETDR